MMTDTKIKTTKYIASDGTEFEHEWHYRRYESRLIIMPEFQKIKESKNIIYHKNIEGPPLFLLPPLDDYVEYYFDDERYYYFTPINSQGAKEIYDFLENIKKAPSNVFGDDLSSMYMPIHTINKPVIIIIDSENGYVACQPINSMVKSFNLYLSCFGYDIELKKG